jgi:malate dehydrogenase (oxaloacetate-decarboxylating)(NADP+)
MSKRNKEALSGFCEDMDNDPEDKRGYELINDARVNKGTSFSREERDELGLRGLLPYRIASQDFQIQRVMSNLETKTTNIGKYIFLRSLENRNERLYYRVIMEHIRELMPIVYTPTVGEACLEFAQIFRHAKGFYITPEDRGQIRQILDNWPTNEVKIIVVTDGERILGLGDLGANGMGIPIGKLDLYIAGGGIDPKFCLPVMLDVGTENRELLDNPFYLGWPERRLRGSEYLSLVEEFVFAVQDKFPKALIQFEDFATPNAYLLMERFQNAVLSFNDDIQGTAAVAVAGMKSAVRISGTPFADLRVMFLGAGSAATGIARLLIRALQFAGLEEAEARSRIIFVDEHGVLSEDREDLSDFNREFAVAGGSMSFVEAIESFAPHALIGATGVPGTFNREAIETMAMKTERPIIFALSNPTDRAECTAEQAYRWTAGRGIFASGSPFEAVEINGILFQPAQGNNVYIFPGVGLGAIAVAASRVSDGMFLAAADRLSELIDDETLQRGALYPALNDLHRISLEVAIAVAEQAYRENLARMPRPANLQDHISGMMYSPEY